MMVRLPIVTAQELAFFCTPTTMRFVSIGASILWFLVTPLWARRNDLQLMAFAPQSRFQGSSSTQLRSSSIPSTATGLYRPFCEYAFMKLEESGLFLPCEIPSNLQGNTAPAKGMLEGSIVKMETKALKANSKDVSYARYALLETLVADNQNDVSTKGIQVMNLVVFPSNQTALPVWGVDLVSLPGNKHLLAMDVQPMTTQPVETEWKKHYDRLWKRWHENYVQDEFEWGGAMPPEASKFFSPFALWTRLSGEDAVDVIQNQVFDAFCESLDLYLQMLHDYNAPDCENNHQEEYLQYRLKNDPARPMLQSLYGPDWTEEVLTKVLFPLDM
jgi:hypothetical protein